MNFLGRCSYRTRRPRRGQVAAALDQPRVDGRVLLPHLGVRIGLLRAQQSIMAVESARKRTPA